MVLKNIVTGYNWGAHSVEIAGVQMDQMGAFGAEFAVNGGE